jgi:hypothetical protein
LIVIIGGLGRTPVTPTVMRDDAVAAIQEEHHLGVPIVGAQGQPGEKTIGCPLPQPL